MRKFLKSIPKSVWYIFLAALVLRLVGIWHGFPLHINIDEPAFVSTVLNLKNGPNPGHFDWPHLYFYFNFPIYSFFYFARQIVNNITPLPEVVMGTSFAFFILRTVTVIISSLAVLAVYKLGEKVFSPKAGILAALIFALIPLNVYEAHLAKSDSAVALLAAISLYFIYQIYEKNRLKDYIWAGVFIGLATSTKYNGALLFVYLVPAVILNLLNRGNPFKRVTPIWSLYIKHTLAAGVASVITFFLTTPYALLDWSTFMSSDSPQGMLWQSRNLGHTPKSEFLNKMVWVFTTRLRTDLSFSVWILFIVAVILLVFFNRRRPKDLLITLPTVALLIFTARFKRSAPHYYLFLFPAIALTVTDMLLSVANKVGRGNRAPTKKTKNVGAGFPSPPLLLVVALFLIQPIIINLTNVYKFSRPDTRTLAYHWIQENLTENDRLYSIGTEIEHLVFKKDKAERVVELDDRILPLQKNLPFYVLIGQAGITYENLTTGSRDPEDLPGNSSRVLEMAELLFYESGQGRFGPPTFVFRVEEIGE